MQDLGYGVEVTDRAKDFLVDKGYDEKFGARPLKRAIQKYLEDPIAEEIINGNVSEGDLLRTDHEPGTEVLQITHEKAGFLPVASAEPESADPTDGGTGSKTTKDGTGKKK
jgi:ATP-dependent Clp protease ATP-binding subunit ClpA